MKDNKVHHHNHSYGKRERCLNVRKGVPFVLTTLLMASIFCLFFLYSPTPLTLVSNQSHGIFENPLQNQEEEVEHAMTTTTISSSIPQKEQKKCDLFKGHWVPDVGGTLYYTNSSCTTIPDSKNCFKHGRKDTDFVNWKWKPDECELPRFDSRTFLHMVRGKKMAFIGDSVARNNMDSLLCLLSQEEVPKDIAIYKDTEDRYPKWYFPNHDFTLMMLWSRFLIVAEERIVNNTGTSIFDMQLDKVDNDWTRELADLDYAIISDGHWFFRIMYLYKSQKLIGCVFCNQPNVKKYDIDFPLRMAFRSTFKHINNCKKCRKGLVTILRTFAPAHFENGGWNNGGYCNRTSPMNEGEVDLGRFDWKLRNIQMEEAERARNKGKKRIFEVVDVTRAMLMRPDGHPGEHWGNKWMRGYNDCTHWCLPGPIDLWSELLLHILKRD